ncbi:MAG: 50S ribosomal protein L5 [Candidatus Komeilibacteria bacterium RIFCSPLOWO2_02_FULL_48_11]|uniref:Large ribosomal subunit protein uL5 n=1 Tax=Candidatus Komeilibacteria bacterium RIFCSPLOWO2_02_FULL_48_11 TaxID=1798553 RepID=A0A1G2BSK9_9BACT|nr:MAG: 50S ribosomal protein L5 [Candidatus Komeilibacteria bacterium RIFCSPLOWO2_02_FULL_48_11]
MWQSIQDKYKKNILPRREELFGVKNIMAAPRIDKVVLNARVKRGGTVNEEVVAKTLERLSGQKAVLTKARQSISNFKIREGLVVGAKVTLRGARALDFLDRLINIVLPRVRDFNGLSPLGFDGHGNYTVGLREHVVFPEAASDDMSQVHGLEITVATTAKNNEKALVLLKELGFPFKAKAEKKEKKHKKRERKEKE